MASAQADAELGLCGRMAEHVPEWRKRKGRHSLEALAKQPVFQTARGYEDHNDSDSPREDPSLKAVRGSSPHSGADLASQPTISGLENAPQTLGAATGWPRSSSNSTSRSARKAAPYATTFGIALYLS